MTDPRFLQRWAREQKLGNATRKLILTNIAVMAESNTGYCFASQGDLADYAECSTKTVGKHLAEMERVGLIARKRRFSPSGNRIADGFLLLAPGIEAWPDGTLFQAAEGPTEDSSTGHSEGAPQEPQGSEQERPNRTTRSKEKNAPAHARESLPEDFPDELLDHARHIFRVLRSIAQQHGTKEVWPREVGLAMMRYRHRPLVATVHDFQAWAVDPPRQIRDVVSTYRTFLKGERDIAVIESLDDQGVPVASSAVQKGSNVTPFRRGGSNSDKVNDALTALENAEQAGAPE